MAKSNTTRSRALKAKASRKVEKAEKQPSIWLALDNLHTRLFTLQSALDFIADNAPNDSASIFYFIGDALEREYEAVGALRDRLNVPGAAS